MENFKLYKQFFDFSLNLGLYLQRFQLQMLSKKKSISCYLALSMMSLVLDWDFQMRYCASFQLKSLQNCGRSKLKDEKGPDPHPFPAYSIYEYLAPCICGARKSNLITPNCTWLKKERSSTFKVSFLSKSTPILLVP